jgi:hypothetical protein
MVAMNMVMMRPREILWVIAVTAAAAAVMVVAAAVVVLINSTESEATLWPRSSKPSFHDTNELHCTSQPQAHAHALQQPHRKSPRGR